MKHSFENQKKSDFFHQTVLPLVAISVAALAFSVYSLTDSSKRKMKETHQAHHTALQNEERDIRAAFFRDGELSVAEYKKAVNDMKLQKFFHHRRWGNLCPDNDRERSE